MKTQQKLYVNRSFNCSVSELFDWLIKPELIAKWFGPKHLETVDVQSAMCEGGVYSIELKKPDQDTFFIEGKYTEINKPHFLSFSLKYRGLKTLPPKSMVKITLEELGPNSSKLSLSQSFESIPADMENRAKAWEYMLELLAQKVVM